MKASGCALDGKWGNGEGCEYRFDNGNWEYSWRDGVLPVARGTFAAGDGTITLERTHVHSTIARSPLMIDLASAWYSRDALESAMLAGGFSPEAAVEALEGFFSPQSENYFVDGDTLVLTLFGEEETWVRRTESDI